MTSAYFCSVSMSNSVVSSSIASASLRSSRFAMRARLVDDECRGDLCVRCGDFGDLSRLLRGDLLRGDLLRGDLRGDLLGDFARARGDLCRPGERTCRGE